MTSEKFRPWEPHPSAAKRLEVTSIRDEDEGLCVVLAPEDTRVAHVRIVFADFVAYRNVNESFRTRTWLAHDFGQLPNLLIVEGSQWLKWLCEESGGILEEMALTHYAIYTSDDCIDVASREAPVAIEVSERSPA